MAPSWVYSMISCILWARFWVLQITVRYCPQNVRIWQNSSIVRSYSPYGYGNDLSEVRSSSGSQYSWTRPSVFAVLVFSECNTLLYWNLTPAYMYVRSKILLLVVLPPQMWVLGDVRTVSVRPPCVPNVSVGPLSKSPCRAPSTNAAGTREYSCMLTYPSYVLGSRTL